MVIGQQYPTLFFLCVIFLCSTLSLPNCSNFLYKSRARYTAHFNCKINENDVSINPVKATGSSVIRLAFVQHPYIGEDYLIDNTIEDVLLKELNKATGNSIPPKVHIEGIQQNYIKDQNSQSIELSVQVLPMPNIYELNDKRFEKRWLDYIRSLNLSDNYDYVIATESGSSEALLRFLEVSSLKNVILTDALDLYTSGERHGRDYRYSKIMENLSNSITFTMKKPTTLDRSIRSYSSTFLKELKEKVNSEYYVYDDTQPLSYQEFLSQLIISILIKNS